MDLHALFKGGYIVVHKRCVTVVLLHMDSAILVISEVLAITTVEHFFEGRDDAVVHGVHLVSPKDMVKSAKHLTSILGCREFLHMLHVPEVMNNAWRMDQTFLESVRKVGTNGP